MVFVSFTSYDWLIYTSPGIQFPPHSAASSPLPPSPSFLCSRSRSFPVNLKMPMHVFVCVCVGGVCTGVHMGTRVYRKQTHIGCLPLLICTILFRDKLS